MTIESTVYVVDDDDTVRRSMCDLLVTAEYLVKDYSSARLFLEDSTPKTGCLITDIRLPEMDGLALQDEVAKRQMDLKVVIVTGHGDVPLAVRAMKAGAVDFIEKPFDENTFLVSVRRAVELGRRTRSQAEEAKTAQRLMALLTPRERHVLSRLVAGRSNKAAAHELGISPRTIEVYRAQIMDKLNASSFSDLVRTAIVASRAPMSRH
jgi:two-component system, LuxR family, response regulator FixJ